MGSVKTNVKKFILYLFMYQIIHNILYTNAILCKMKKKTKEPFCPFCAKVKQSVTHLFVSCPIAVSFWSEFSQWYQSLTQKSLILCKKEIIYGVLKNFVWSSCSTLSHLILIGKYLLYCKALNGIKTQFSNLLSLVQEKTEIEKYITTTNNKCGAFSEKWHDFIN